MSDQDKRLGVYFHIPFCASKCAYCDFCSLPGRDKLMPYYQDALLIQLQETMPRMTDYFIDTVYFGGGTPSYYGARRIVEILQELKVTNRLMKQSEITVECNPDSVRRKELRMLRKEGVNRLSIGAQSANDDILRLIGRRHNWRQVEMAVKRARKAGFRNVSLDLIYGLPSQTREDWADTLTKALALKPAHIDAHQRLSHDNRIEIRRKHLLLHALGRILAHESAFAVMHAFDDAFIVAIGRRHVDDIARCRAHVGALHQSRCVLAAKLPPVVQADKRVAAVKFDHSSLHKH